jgi:RNA-directed DNA polymerase
MAGVLALGPCLVKRVADARTLRTAWNRLSRAGKSPGPDQLRFDDFDNTAIWALCRNVARALRDGHVPRQPERRVQIPKPGKPGAFRTIVVQSIIDRLIASALASILSPILDLMFCPFSFGFRPRRGRLEAVATALAHAEAAGCWTWVSVDVAKAFDRIPLVRLLELTSRLFPDDLVSLVEQVADTGNKRGVRQGSPLSPLLANLYFDHYIDRPWYARHPDQVMIRYADNLLILCRTREQAREALAEIARLARSAGTPLNDAGDSAIVELDAGQSVDWLGFQITREQGRVRLGIAERAWRKLESRLVDAHERPASPIVATQVIEGWLGQMGAYAEDGACDPLLARISRLAEAHGFDEIPAPWRLKRGWLVARRRWRRCREDQLQRLPSRLARISSYLALKRDCRRPVMVPVAADMPSTPGIPSTQFSTRSVAVTERPANLLH